MTQIEVSQSLKTTGQSISVSNTAGKSDEIKETPSVADTSKLNKKITH
jgi:hypothetical protein